MLWILFIGTGKLNQFKLWLAAPNDYGHLLPGNIDREAAGIPSL